MSNARYFANGVDFWRVIYDDDTTEGPYFNAVAAKRVGMTGTRKRKDSKGTIFQSKKSYRLQKLTASADHDNLPYLAWEDWSA